MNLLSNAGPSYDTNTAAFLASYPSNFIKLSQTDQKTLSFVTLSCSNVHLRPRSAEAKSWTKKQKKPPHNQTEKKAQFSCSITYLQIIASCLFYNGGHYRKLFIQSRYYISYFSTLKLSSHINHNRFGSRVCVSVTRCVH